MKTRVKWGIALRLGLLLASFSVFAAILAGYYTFDSSRERLQGRQVWFSPDDAENRSAFESLWSELKGEEPEEPAHLTVLGRDVVIDRTAGGLARATFAAMGRPEDITFIDTPADIRDKYQYFTEAEMDKLRSIGYDRPFHTLEEGVTDYVRNHLERR